MGTSIELDQNNEIVFDETGQCGLVSEDEDIMQAIRVELCQNKEQWLLNTNFGVPWLNKNNTGVLQGKLENRRIINEVFKVIKKYSVDRIKNIEFIDNSNLKKEIVLKGQDKELIIE